MSGVCEECARRAWLLAKLNVRLDFKARDLSRLWSTLELSDQQMIEATGGRRRAELHSAYAEWEPAPARGRRHAWSICRHHPSYPKGLREDPLAPHALEIRGGAERLQGMLEQRIVAIVGTRRASDYGMETARKLARGLAASGLVVASEFTEGIPTAVHAGTLEVEGMTLTVTAGGVERCSPAWCAPLYRRVTASGCAISEVHSSQRSRHWWQHARARTLALLSQMVIVVEAGEKSWELACAHVAQSRGRHVAAVPGRVSSSTSRGTNSLLMSGARLVRGPQDALDVLYGVGVRSAGDQADGKSIALEPRLAQVLERVGCGEDTLERLARDGAPSSETAVALAELELEGLLVRGDGGRYVPSARVPTC